MNVADVAPLLPFYRDVLGFHVSDYGLTPYPLYFFHINGRHHSLRWSARARPASTISWSNSPASTMSDRATTSPSSKKGGLFAGAAHQRSRHFVLFADTVRLLRRIWLGRPRDRFGNLAAARNFDGPSFWGHERLHLPDEQRKRLRDMRLPAAARGVRAPLPIENYAWLDSVIACE